MLETRRTAKIGQLMQSRLALLFQKEPPIKNGLLTIMNVEVSVDLSYANIYVSLIGVAEPKLLLKALNEKNAYYRSHIAKNWTSKKVPQLKFIHDETQEKAYELTQLIDTVSSEDIDS